MITWNKNLAYLLAAVALVATGCSKSDEAAPSPCSGNNCTGTPIPNGGGGGSGSSSLDDKPLLQLGEYINDVAPPVNQVYTDRIEKLQIFFGDSIHTQIVNGMGAPHNPNNETYPNEEVEGGTTGIKMIVHSDTGTAEMRFKTETLHNGLLSANFVSIPGTVTYGSTVDAIFSTATQYWYPAYGAAYSLVRVKADISGSTLVNGSVCVRTVGVNSDWSGGNLYTPVTIIGQLFTYTYFGTNFNGNPYHNTPGTYPTLTTSDRDTLRARFVYNGTYCAGYQTYADNPNNFVQRQVGTFTNIPVSSILP